MRYEESLEEIEEVVRRLKVLNESVPIVVEGEKDVDALRSLGMEGKILTLHSGKKIVDFCDMIASEYAEIVVLTDWDRKGGKLSNALEQNLGGRTRCIMEFREMLARNTMVRDIESIPAYIKHVKIRIEKGSRQSGQKI